MLVISQILVVVILVAEVVVVIVGGEGCANWGCITIHALLSAQVVAWEPWGGDLLGGTSATTLGDTVY